MPEYRDRTEYKEQKSPIVIGQVESLFLYPFKSMKGIEQEQIGLNYIGIEGDRQWAYVQDPSKSTFPWISIRLVPNMVRYEPSFVEPANPRKSGVIVRTPDGHSYPADSEELRIEIESQIKPSGDGQRRRIRLLRGNTFPDALPVSLLSDRSLRELSHATQMEIEVARLRPNILVRLRDPNFDFDNEVVHTILTFGDRPDSPQVAATWKDPRCAIPGVNPKTGIMDKKVVKVLSDPTGFNNQLGVYGNIVKPGIIYSGDKITMIRI